MAFSSSSTQTRRPFFRRGSPWLSRRAPTPSASTPRSRLSPRAAPATATARLDLGYPVASSSLAKRGVALTLSGHTHWGQFALPKLGWSLASPFLEHAMGAHTVLFTTSPGKAEDELSYPHDVELAGHHRGGGVEA